MHYAVKRPSRSSFDFELIEDPPAIYDLTVYEDDGYESTGILDPDGNEIVRCVKAPLGFLSEMIECSE